MTTLQSGCLASSTATFVLLALSTAQKEIGYTTLNNVQLSATGTNALTFTAAWSTAIPQTVALTHLPLSARFHTVNVRNASVNGPGPYEGSAENEVATDAGGNAGSITVLAHTAGALFQ